MYSITYNDVLETFESSFVDKYEIPDALFLIWFKRAIGDFGLNIDKLDYLTEAIEEDGQSTTTITITLTEEQDENKDVITNTLAQLIHLYYQEREYSRVNKINNIIGKDISLNNTDSTKKNTKEEYDKIQSIVNDYFSKQKATAYN